MERRALIVECALQVVAEGGLKALTHRAVDRAAGLVEGSTGNHFPRRADLVRAITRHVDARDRELFQAVAVNDVATVDDLALLYARAVVGMVSPEHAPVARVRLAIMSGDRDAAADFHRGVLSSVEETLEGLGADHAEHRARAVFAFLDGTVLQAVSVDPRPLDEAVLEQFFRLLITQPISAH